MTKASKTTVENPSKKIQRLEQELAHIKEREQILLHRYDRVSARLDGAFRSPVSFALSRLFHQYIKRDQKNVG